MLKKEINIMKKGAISWPMALLATLVVCLIVLALFLLFGRETSGKLTDSLEVWMESVKQSICSSLGVIGFIICG